MSTKPYNPKVLVEWCPYDSALFAAGADSLSLYECQTQREMAGNNGMDLMGVDVDAMLHGLPPVTTARRKKDIFRMVQTNSDIAQVKSLQWCPLPRQLIAAGVGAGKVILSDFSQTVVELMPSRTSGSSTNLLQPMTGLKSSRPSMHTPIACNTVAWNPHNPTQIAAGFEKVRVDSCAFVWDLTTQTPMTSLAAGPILADPLHYEPKQNHFQSRSGAGFSFFTKPMITHELSHSEAIVAMAWLPSDPSYLATGTGFKWLRIYDLRTKTTPMVVSAHTKGVYGVVFDTHRPHILATYSDDPKEPVKVWDIRSIRQGDAPEPLVSIYPSGKAITQIAWSPTKPGILATTTSDDRSISLWDVDQPSGSLRKPIKRRSTKEPVFAFSWRAVTNADVVANPDRLVTASITGKLENVSIHDTMPLALASTGQLGFGCGKFLFADASGVPERRGHDDIAARMVRRVKAGYSMNVLTSLQIFVKEDNRDLRFVWMWVEQVEALRRHAIATLDMHSQDARGLLTSSLHRGPLRAWPIDAQALMNAGVQHLLGLSKAPSLSSSSMETSMRDPNLGCLVYDSLGRRTALLACQWDPECGLGLNASAMPRTKLNNGSWASLNEDHMDDPPLASSLPSLSSLLAQCEATHDYDRAAALAVFHGDLLAAVSVLQRGADSDPHRDVRQLVAMAIAGYSVNGPTTNALWGSMILQLLKRQELQSTAAPRYLHALCSFLSTAKDLAASTSTPLHRPPKNNVASHLRRNSSASFMPVVDDGPPLFAAILHDETLLLSDRTAFACRFLPLDALTRFIDTCVERCVHEGNLQGLLLIGLDPTLLQEYLDRTGDIQTIALLAARVVPSEYPMMTTWISLYRDLLNQWQLFHERALFDVGRAQLMDQLTALSAPDGSNAPAPLALPQPQMYVRCNFCGSSLALSSLLRVGNGDWLVKAKPKLNNCPSCKKPLPQCALCLLPFGALNPYLELALRKGDKLKAEHENNSSHADSLADLSSIPFAEWFTWCQTCKHGGHAHHMTDWFAAHDVCPVSDCDCPCKQLDGPVTRPTTAFASTSTPKSPVLTAQPTDYAAMLEQQLQG
ncbi:hypothetical protein SPRG_02602 [Saprolegnia parasitica CBS 223.65]|uniref:Uncharacterized protein n=1 Tax=Saprolegnia parasitica (strain CBS 223.65) TaxID=695850 RepID=A0A067CUH4_SAPPC|nr:hypothetical protein SPRG_02602 [Saprolegnia parasitica CBS 223.65]KDO32910.1 hypothetical protein SPRG_02602 [Saprolegnia parasitica CBS 223.65]|eukprot:XP_012196558.1 hypothetical protein SPRG_02602 [Saprolegnia parasitica CBS 223.65]